MTAARIARTLPGSIRHGNGFLVRCPVPSHGKGRGDRSPSLSIADGDSGKLLVRCFTGCDSRDVLAALKQRGLLGDRPRISCPRAALPAQPVDPEPDARAVAIWRSAEPVNGTVGEDYLRARGITAELLPSLRFLRDAEYSPHVYFPALVAAVQEADRRIIAVQLTFLDGDRKANVARPRKTIGALARGAVRFGAAAENLGIAEGVETALSAMQIHAVPAWACLGASRMASVAIPANVGRLFVFADRDAPGHDAALAAAERFRQRVNVSVRFPPDGCKDWNVALTSKGRAAA
jgi:putative DNA primase/helicase